MYSDQTKKALNCLTLTGVTTDLMSVQFYHYDYIHFILIAVYLYNLDSLIILRRAIDYVIVENPFEIPILI